MKEGKAKPKADELVEDLEPGIYNLNLEEIQYSQSLKEGSIESTPKVSRSPHGERLQKGSAIFQRLATEPEPTEFYEERPEDVNRNVLALLNG